MTNMQPDDAPDVPGELAADATDAERITALLESISAYMEHYHNGWVRFVDYEEGVLRVQMGGACVGCALSATTLHGWIEGTLRPFFPNLKRVEAIV